MANQKEEGTAQKSEPTSDSAFDVQRAIFVYTSDQLQEPVRFPLPLVLEVEDHKMIGKILYFLVSQDDLQELASQIHSVLGKPEEV